MVGNQPGLRRFRQFSIFVMRCIPISVLCALPHLMHAFYSLGSILFAAFDIFDQDHGEKMKKIILNIPLPNSLDNAKYSVENKADFKRPASYIHFKVEDPSERLYGPQPLKLHGFCVLPSPQTAWSLPFLPIHIFSYEIDDEDLQFLSELPPPDRRICTDVKLEDVFDMLERESHRSGSKCQCIVHRLRRRIALLFHHLGIAPITVAERANIKP